MIVMGNNKPRSPTLAGSTIFLAKSLFLVLTVSAKVISTYKQCTQPPVVTVVFKVGQTKCPHRCLDLEELYCEDDGVTPLSCETSKDCPFGTCETTACTSITCNEDDSDTVPYEKFKICKGEPPSSYAYESSEADDSICCDKYQISYIIGGGVLFIIAIIVIIALIRKRRGNRVYRRPGAGNTELAMVYSEREVENR